MTNLSELSKLLNLINEVCPDAKIDWANSNNELRIYRLNGVIHELIITIDNSTWGQQLKSRIDLLTRLLEKALEKANERPSATGRFDL
jgi:hypothetical protein